MKKVQYETMLPHEIVAARNEFPVAYLPVGGVEWHGRHLAVGNDTIKAHALCVRAAKQGVAQDKVTGAVPWAPYIAGPAHWGNWEEAPFQSLRDNNGAGIPVPDLIYFARTYTPNEADWQTGEAWPIFLTDDEIALLPPISLHTDDLDTLRDEGIAFSKRLAQAGKLVGHVNHIGSTHALHVYTPIFHATDIMELAAKSVTAFALRA